MRKLLFFILVAILLTLSCFAQDYNGYIIRIADDTMSLLGSNISELSGASLMGDMDDSEVVELISEEFDTVKEINSDHMLVKAEDDETLEMLMEMGVVESYEKDYFLELHGYDVTQNANYDDQKWYLGCINADFAWNAGIFGDEVRVAVIDSGVYPHKDIENNLIKGKNYVNESSPDDTTDNVGHGTSVAGIIASRCNDLATVGIAFKTKVVPLKVTDSKELSMSLAVKAIYDAVDTYNCDVINMSFGDTNKSTMLEDAVMYAISRGVIAVASAGNKGNTGYMYPASFDDVISVANVCSSYLNYVQYGSGLCISSSSQRNDKIDIAAPGTGIAAISKTGSVADVSGTSFSAPMVAAVAALAKSVNPDIGQSEFQSLIKQSANSSYLTTSGQDETAWGAGLLDIEAFFKLMLAGKDCYVSDNIVIDDEVFVYITNLSDTKRIEDCTVVISERDSTGAIIKTENISKALDVSQSLEISLTELGYSSLTTVRVVVDHMPGDVNGDGEITTMDVMAILKYIAKYPDDSTIESALDVSGDGEVSTLDVMTLLRYLAGYPVDLH
ncbi:MAG: S8 family serine peptidase [Clostridia bacterium]|nr:S8 family serine peptidase [Clostridia bacterium]